MSTITYYISRLAIALRPLRRAIFLTWVSTSTLQVTTLKGRHFIQGTPRKPPPPPQDRRRLTTNPACIPLCRHFTLPTRSGTMPLQQAEEAPVPRQPPSTTRATISHTPSPT